MFWFGLKLKNRYFKMPIVSTGNIQKEMNDYMIERKKEENNYIYRKLTTDEFNLKEMKRKIITDEFNNLKK